MEHRAAIYPEGGSQGLTQLSSEVKAGQRRTSATLAALALAGLATALILAPQPRSDGMALLAPIAASLLLLTSVVILWRNLVSVRAS